MRLSLTLTFLALLTSCGGKVDTLSPENLKLISSKIYGGERVEEGSWRSVVSISKVNYKGEVTNTFCTGTLIDESTVLTAAHCFKRVKDYYKRNSGVTLQNTDAGERSFIKIKNIKIHPSYRGEDSDYDFAIVDLEKSAGVLPSDIIAPSSREEISIGEEVDLVGFGKIEDGSSGVKFEVRTSVREDFKVEFTAGGDGNDTCAGDSGGPVFIENSDQEYELFGVTSRSPDDAIAYCGDKTVYGKVSTAMKWVRAERIIDRAIEADSLESIELLKKANIELPNYFLTHSLLGKFYLKFNQLDNAIRSLTSATILNRDDVETLKNLKEVYVRLGDEKLEKLILGRLLVLEPSSEDHFKRLVFLGEIDDAQILRGIGNFKRDSLAFAALDLELHRSNPKAAFVLAFSEFKMSNFENALKILKEIPSDSIGMIDLRDSSEDTFLTAATFEDQGEIVEELLRFAPALSVKDSYGNNLAEIAWWGRAFTLVKLFVSLGVEWNPDDYFSQFTAFISNEYIEEVRFMLEMGIDLSLVGPKGETAINLARETKNVELIKLVESYGKEKSIK